MYFYIYFYYLFFRVCVLFIGNFAAFVSLCKSLYHRPFDSLFSSKWVCVPGGDGGLFAEEPFPGLPALGPANPTRQWHHQSSLRTQNLAAGWCGETNAAQLTKTSQSHKENSHTLVSHFLLLSSSFYLSFKYKPNHQCISTLMSIDDEDIPYIFFSTNPTKNPNVTNSCTYYQRLIDSSVPERLALVYCNMVCIRVTSFSHTAFLGAGFLVTLWWTL